MHLHRHLHHQLETLLVSKVFVMDLDTKSIHHGQVLQQNHPLVVLHHIISMVVLIAQNLGLITLIIPRRNQLNTLGHHMSKNKIQHLPNS